MIVHLNLDPETERVLREKAAQNGLTLGAYLEAIAEREAWDDNGEPGPVDLAAFERGLEEVSEGLPPLPTLPPEFSRADIYDEHA